MQPGAEFGSAFIDSPHKDLIGRGSEFGTRSIYLFLERAWIPQQPMTVVSRESKFGSRFNFFSTSTKISPE